MIDRKALLTDLIKQVRAVEADLGRQVHDLSDVREQLRTEYDQAKRIGRTAATWTAWLDERITQVAVAWVLGTVFVRFCEDNLLISEPFLAAPTVEQMQLAEERYAAYRDSDADPTYRGWLKQSFDKLGSGQAGKLLFDPRHNALYQIPISHDGARALVEFWRTRNEAGALDHDFTDPLSADGTQGWDTRFLGDLYQDLSENARKAYALLQTPEFVEEFILDRAMNPALREFGYQELKMIDPTCGSGHFVLGAFQRLVGLWAEKQPNRDAHERVRAALDSVHGVDINPFAVAVARFRLLLAAMAAAGIRTLADANKYDWPLHLAVGDSLIKERQLEFGGHIQTQEDGSLALSFGEEKDELAEFSYATEDVHEHKDILKEGRYHVVVGNPPYITVKDKILNKLYRDLYKSSAGKYALSVPFAERFFQLAQPGGEGGRGYGYVGQITSNSFMKREFGAKLIEEYFAHKVELIEVIDSSGAYIPGHGTPTVILIGRRRAGKDRAETVLTVRSVQGEPSVPEDPADGRVWNAIVGQIKKPSSPDQKWVTVADLDRSRYFNKHPWMLMDGGLEMVEQLDATGVTKLGKSSSRLGVFGMTNADDVMLTTHDAWVRRSCEEGFGIGLIQGDEVRDWDLRGDTFSFFPYDAKLSLRDLPDQSGAYKWIWPSRTTMGHRATFSGGTYFSDGRSWYEWHQVTPSAGAHNWTITFAEVATHNHFCLERGNKVFKQTAPIVKLLARATEEEHLRLLGLLNSSTACFWLKMRCHNKGGSGLGRGFQDEAWENRYQFNGANVEQFPIPASCPTALATTLDNLAQQLAATSPTKLALSGTPAATAALLREAREKWENVRGKMIALQEELDWWVYSSYGVHSEDLRTPCEADVPELKLGERAFEIVLGRRVKAGEASDDWFKRHGSTPISDLPEHWSGEYKALVAKRIKVIEDNRAIGMLERPEYKRRWVTEGWPALQEKSLRSWLLDRMEARDLWFEQDALGHEQPQIRTLAVLTDMISHSEEFVSVSALYAPRAELQSVVEGLLADEHVPFLAKLRYRPSGLKKRASWEHVWELQRVEDAAPDEPAKRKVRDRIPVPPKYTSADFVRPSYWRARGRLDVPKERFISYADDLGTPTLFGWSGWDYREQAQALTVHLTDRAQNHAATKQELTPLLAGLLELQPWLSQWHHEFDPMYSMGPDAFFAGYRSTLQGEYGLTDDDLRSWRPAPAARRRTAKKQS